MVRSASTLLRPPPAYYPVPLLLIQHQSIVCLMEAARKATGRQGEGKVWREEGKEGEKEGGRREGGRDTEFLSHLHWGNFLVRHSLLKSSIPLQ